ncbi:MAG: DUF2283 domain-containing protein [Spirochaetes bacterium]|nr:DUF2283 domain-containing protein [Spirochaetota bacterium]
MHPVGSRKTVAVIEVREGINLDMLPDGRISGIEILDALKNGSKNAPDLYYRRGVGFIDYATESIMNSCPAALRNRICFFP